MLVIKLSTPTKPFTAQEIQSHLSSQVEGKQIPFTDDDLTAITDIGRVKKIYKLNGNANAGSIGGKKNARKSEVNGSGGAHVAERIVDSKELEVLILGAMALRGATN